MRVCVTRFSHDCLPEVVTHPRNEWKRNKDAIVCIR